MNEEQNEPVFMFDGNDEAMQAACSKAKETFKYFWREMSWERRRIVPAFELLLVKLPFTDGKRTDGNPAFEHMWVDEVEFDGETISGVLINTPNWLKSVKSGDQVSSPLSLLEDWMIVAERKAYGAFTINAMRMRMNETDRKEHDDASGLEFGDPTEISIHPFQKTSVATDKELESHNDAAMCINMLPKIEDALQKNSTPYLEPGEKGWTMLHHEALAGNFGAVKLLVKYGADIQAKTHSGKTAAGLAKILGWDEIAAYLQNAAKS